MTYTLTLTPVANQTAASTTPDAKIPKDWGLEGALDVALVSGKSIQRDGYIQTYSSSKVACICIRILVISIGFVAITYKKNDSIKYIYMCV